MLKQPAKYNPAFLSEEKLIKSFVARHTDLSLIIGILKENIGQPSNQHILILGQRGIGKTTLVLRVAAEVQRDEKLKEAWFPLIFSEESYEVATPGEFWLEAIFHLGEVTGDERWKRTYKELKSEADENRLRERALAQLMDFADSIGRRLLLIVENFDMLLADQLDKEDAWAIRHTLQNEPRVMMLATAIKQMDEISAIDKAMFELFKVYELKPLDNDESRLLWTSITGREISEKMIKPIQILTGGNPRLLTIISTFGANMSFKELMADIMHLVDDHTEYFKSHLDNLAPVERKVYLALADLWDPSPARTVAASARLDVNKASSLLNRLVDRGAVVVVDGGKRTKWYQLSERMYNIYYLMRRRGAPSSRVQALVNFMVSFYNDEELLNITKCIATEACQLSSEMKEYNYYAYKSIIERISDQRLADRFIKVTPLEFFKPSNMPESFAKDFVARIPSKVIKVKKQIPEKLLLIVEEILRLSKDEKNYEEVILRYKKATKLAPNISSLWTGLAVSLVYAKKYKDAKCAFRKAIEIEPEDSFTWMQFGLLCHEKLKKYEDAEQAYRKVIQKEPDNAQAWARLGQLLDYNLGNIIEAEQAYKKALEIDPTNDWVLGMLGDLLCDKLGKYDEAEKVYLRLTELKTKNETKAWAELGELYHKKLGKYEKAEMAYRKAIELDPVYDWALGMLGDLLRDNICDYRNAEECYVQLIKLKTPNEYKAWAELGYLYEKIEDIVKAEQAYRKSIELFPKNAKALTRLGLLLHHKMGKYNDAEQAYREAISVKPDDAFSWAMFGYLLYEHSDRYEEADQAYCKALEIDPEHSWIWLLRGILLDLKLKSYNEAELAYRKAIELQPDNDHAWICLGLMLFDKLNKTDEAEDALKQAFVLNPTSLESIKGISCLYLQNNQPEKLIVLSEEYAEVINRSAVALNYLAWAFYKYGYHDFLVKAEKWALKAINLIPEDACYRHTLASILTAQGKCDVALEQTNIYLQNTEKVGKHIDDATDLIVNLAVRGYAEKTLKLLVESPANEILKPLIVGIRLYLGEEVLIANEILEVGKDVMNRIKEKETQLSADSNISISDGKPIKKPKK